MNKRIVHDALILTAFTLVLGFILALVQGITAEPIDKANKAAAQKAYQAVFSDAKSFEKYDYDADEADKLVSDAGYKDTIDDIETALDSNKETLGYVITVTAKDGSQGSITFSVGIKNDGTVNGYSITSISETPGLGMKAEEADFYKQFENKKVDKFDVVKTTPSKDDEIEVIKENPTFVLMLGMCPTLAVTSSAVNGLGMGLSTTVVLICSNLLISLFRKVIPNGVRMPAYIVIVASLVTVVQFLMQAYLPSLSAALGVYIPLIVVNCIILGRAESYASKNPPVESIFDGMGMGLGFTMGLTIIGLIREILGAGTFFNIKIFGDWFTPITIFIMAPGAFLVLGFLVAGMNIIRKKMEAKGTPLAEPAGCLSGDCAHCGASCPSAKAAQAAVAPNTTEGGDK